MAQKEKQALSEAERIISFAEDDLQNENIIVSERKLSYVIIYYLLNAIFTPIF